MNVVLIGMPACGKSAVAEALGKRLNMRVVDTDGEIRKNHGDITEIFVRLGEEKFRQIETETVKAASCLDNVIISTGGGCPVRGENVSLLKRNGKTVYLRAALPTLLSRLGDDNSRPLLAGGAEEKLTKLLNERTPVYKSAADFITDTDGLTVEEICKNIEEWLNL